MSPRLQLTSSQRLPAMLLGVVALWALLFAIAGLTGLGGRYRLHPDDPARVPPLPALDLSRARSPLEPAEAYADIGERPLFNADRRPLPVDDAKSDAAAGSEEPAPAAPLDIVVTSIIMTPQLQLAIVTDKRSGKSTSVKVGQALEGDMAGWTLKELQARKAVFSGPGGDTATDLRVFDGSGGQSPSPAAVAQATEANGNPQAVAPQAPPPPTPPGAGQAVEGEAKAAPLTPEQRSEMIRRRIEERRRQMREEAARANNS